MDCLISVDGRNTMDEEMNKERVVNLTKDRTVINPFVPAPPAMTFPSNR